MTFVPEFYYGEIAGVEKHYNSDHHIDHEHEEGVMVVETSAAADPFTVVVHFEDTGLAC